MKVFILILCVSWLFLSYKAYHICKAKYVEPTNEFAFLLGSLISVIIDGVCWYWLFKMIGL